MSAAGSSATSTDRDGRGRRCARRRVRRRLDQARAERRHRDQQALRRRDGRSSARGPGRRALCARRGGRRRRGRRWLRERVAGLVVWNGWAAIDAHERAAGDRRAGRGESSFASPTCTRSPETRALRSSGHADGMAASAPITQPMRTCAAAFSRARTVCRGSRQPGPPPPRRGAAGGRRAEALGQGTWHWHRTFAAVLAILAAQCHSPELRSTLLRRAALEDARCPPRARDAAPSGSV